MRYPPTFRDAIADKSETVTAESWQDFVKIVRKSCNAKSRYQTSDGHSELFISEI